MINVSRDQSLNYERATLTEEQFRIKCGYKIRELREQKGLRQTDVADYCGFSKQTQSNIENGETSISLYYFNKILEVLDASYSDFDFLNNVSENSKISVYYKKIHSLVSQYENIEEFYNLLEQLIIYLQKERKSK